jgi:hypothetical protein
MHTWFKFNSNANFYNKDHEIDFPVFFNALDSYEKILQEAFTLKQQVSKIEIFTENLDRLEILDKSSLENSKLLNKLFENEEITQKTITRNNTLNDICEVIYLFKCIVNNLN